MLAQQPDIATLAFRLLWDAWDFVFVCQAFGRLWRHDGGQLVFAESCQLQIKAKALQVCQFKAKHLIVPPSIQRQLVICDHVGLFLCIGQVAESDARDCINFHAACRHDSTVSCNDPPPPINQHRIGEAEFLDRCSDLSHLRIDMGSAVARIGNELVDRDVFD